MADLTITLRVGGGGWRRRLGKRKEIVSCEWRGRRASRTQIRGPVVPRHGHRSLEKICFRSGEERACQRSRTLRRLR
eukprot:749671-Hanusia_phi.AAC.1